jgi:hypothetical protein
MLATVSPTGVPPLSSPLLVNGVAVEQTRTIKYLGVHLDERLLFARHAQSVAARARRMLGAIAAMLRRWHKRVEMVRIYIKCIRPTITYGLAVVYARTEDSRRAVECVNLVAARTVLNTYTAEYTALITRLHWSTIAAIAVVDRLRLMYTYVHNSSSNNNNSSSNNNNNSSSNNNNSSSNNNTNNYSNRNNNTSGGANLVLSRTRIRAPIDPAHKRAANESRRRVCRFKFAQTVTDMYASTRSFRRDKKSAETHETTRRCVLFTC